jgi:hypothetical protein
MNTLYTDLKSHLDSVIFNKTGTIVNVRNLINGAVLKIRDRIDLRGTKKKTSAPYSVYEDIYRYACPSDLKETAIIELRRQLGSDEEWVKTFPEEFERLKGNDNLVAVDIDGTDKTLLISKEMDEDCFTIDDCNSISNITASGDASDLSLDTNNYVEGTGSAKATITYSTGKATFEFDFTSQDLSDYQDVSGIYFNLYLSGITGFTSIDIKIGNDSSNYFTQNVTENADGTAFHTGWNLVKCNWAGATEVGTVDVENIVYACLDFNIGATFVTTTAFNIDNFKIITGEMFNTFYYSQDLWKNSSGSAIEKSTADSDYLELENDEVDLIKKQIEIDGKKQVKESYREDFEELMLMLRDYEFKNPSERMFEITKYN